MQNSQEQENSFNFVNELELSNTKKEKTSEQFYGFDDFNNSMDGVMKSQRTIKLSSLLGTKKNSTEDFFQSINKLKTVTSEKMELFGNKLKQTVNHDKIITSPKFADSVNNASQNSFLKMKNSSKQATSQPESTQVDDYQDIISQIRFYEEETDKLSYENSKLEGLIEQLSLRSSSVSFQNQIDYYQFETTHLNTQIEGQKQLESQITTILSQLEHDYETLTASIANLSFPRPRAIITKQAQKLIDEINHLHQQLQSMQKGSESLNLSATLTQNNLMSNLPSAFQLKNLPTQGLLQAQKMIEQIRRESVTASRPKYVYNIKMACVKDEWTLYSSSEIQINVNYKVSSKIRLHIGNKTNKVLGGFEVAQNGAVVHISQLKGKSYFVHEMLATKQLMQQLFIKIVIRYTIDTVNESVTLFVPAGLANFGQFIPLTEKQFNAEMMEEKGRLISNAAPIDKSIIESIDECQRYFPNLFVSQSGVCCGMFVTEWQETSLIQIKQRNDLLSIRQSTNNQSTLFELISFIFTV